MTRRRRGWRDSLTTEVMRHLSVLLALFILGLVVFALSTLLRSPDTMLTGVVRGPAGAVYGALVTVGTDPDRKAAVTDARGRYRLDFLDPGTIEVHTFAPGLVCDVGTRLQIRRGANVHDEALAAAPAGAGPSFRGMPMARLQSAGGLWRLDLDAVIEPGAGGPPGAEVLAFNGRQRRGVVLKPTAGLEYVARLEAGRVGDLVGAWGFAAADAACDDAPQFPLVNVRPPPGQH